MRPIALRGRGPLLQGRLEQQAAFHDRDEVSEKSGFYGRHPQAGGMGHFNDRRNVFWRHFRLAGNAAVSQYRTGSDDFEHVRSTVDRGLQSRADSLSAINPVFPFIQEATL
jgi:hypothetical protein